MKLTSVLPYLLQHSHASFVSSLFNTSRARGITNRARSLEQWDSSDRIFDLENVEKVRIRIDFVSLSLSSSSSSYLLYCQSLSWIPVRGAVELQVLTSECTKDVLAVLCSYCFIPLAYWTRKIDVFFCAKYEMRLILK